MHQKIRYQKLISLKTNQICQTAYLQLITEAKQFFEYPRIEQNRACPGLRDQMECDDNINNGAHTKNKSAVYHQAGQAIAVPEEEDGPQDAGGGDTDGDFIGDIHPLQAALDRPEYVHYIGNGKNGYSHP